MKKFLIVIFLSCICLIPLFSRAEAGQAWNTNPGNLNGRFILRGEPALLVFIESGWVRDGLVPVVLTFSGLEVYRLVNATDLDTAAGFEDDVSRILAGDGDISFLTYEHNRLRTRMKLADNSQPVQLEIDGETGQVEFFIGSRPLQLAHTRIRVTLEKVADGGEMYEVSFAGPKVGTHGERFVFDPAAGIIYVVHRWGTLTETGFETAGRKGWSVWAVRAVNGRDHQPVKREK